MAFIEREPRSGFIATDRSALSEVFHVTVVRYRDRPTARYVIDAVRSAWRCDATYAWFASEHSLLPALVAAIRRRPFILAAAGYDFANLPEHGYGLAARRRGWLPKLIARLADTVICCSNGALDDVVALVPTAAGKSTVAYLGLEPSEWQPMDVERVPDRVVTVGYVTPTSWSRKGIDRFVAVAAADPHRHYVLGGDISPAARPLLPDPLPANLTVTGFLEHEALRRLLWSAGVYVQLSWHEGFGLAMAEAMLCGCVPVISPIPVLREVAGAWAVVTASTANDVGAIRTAAERPVDRAQMRQDTAERFPTEGRQRALHDAVRIAIARRRRRLNAGR